MKDHQQPISTGAQNSPIESSTTLHSVVPEFKKTHRVMNYYTQTQPERPVLKTKNPAGEVIKRGSSPAGVVLEGTSCTAAPSMVVEESGRERLKRHRVEVAGRVWIPDIWGQEDLLKDWIDCTLLDSALGNNSIMSARAALVEERRTVRIENRC